MVTEDLTLDSSHTMKYTDDIIIELYTCPGWCGSVD